MSNPDLRRVNFQTAYLGNGFEIPVVMVKLRSGLQTGSRDKAVGGLADRKAPSATVSVDERGVLKGV